MISWRGYIFQKVNDQYPLFCVHIVEVHSSEEQDKLDTEQTVHIRQDGSLDFSDKESIYRRLRQAQTDFADLDYEMNCTITSDGKVWIVQGEGAIVNPRGIEKLGSSLKGSYSYHNHPEKETNYSFSAEDVAFFISIGQEFSKASDKQFEYIMQRTQETVDMFYYEVYHRFKEVYKSHTYQLAWDELIDIDMDGFHEATKFLSEEMKFNYERKKVDQ